MNIPLRTDQADELVLDLNHAQDHVDVNTRVNEHDERIDAIESNGLDASVSAIQVDQSAHGFAAGDILRFDGSVWAKALFSGYNSSLNYAIVSSVLNADRFIATLSGLVAGLSGLTPGVTYFGSSLVAGGIQATPPAEAGTVIKPLLLAMSATSGIFFNQRGQINAGSSVYSRLGMNVGNDADGSTLDYPAAENARDLAYLRQYVNKVRVKLEYHLDTVGVGYSQQHALDAKAMGFYVVWGVVAGSVSTAADYATWRDVSVPAAAAWAAAHGIDEFEVFNEEDLWASLGGYDGGAITAADVQIDVSNLASTLQGLYPNMRISGSTAQGMILDWQALGVVDFDRFGFNVYDHDDFPGTLDYFQGVIGADKFFVTEWGYTTPYEDSGLSDAAYKAEIAARLQALKDRDIEAYFFTWRSPAYGAGNDSWAVRKPDDSFKPGIDEIFTSPQALRGAGQIVDITERAPGGSDAPAAAAPAPTTTDDLVAVGAAVGKAHLGVSGGGSLYLGRNVDVAGNIDDPTVPAWRVVLSQTDDTMRIDRAPAGGTWTPSTLLSMDNAGLLGLLGLDMQSHKIVNLLDPTAAQDGATKAYVDGLAVNLGKRQTVRAATTANVTIATALNNGDSIDGVTLVTGDLVLVKNQSTTNQNGVYVVGVSPVRATQFDTYDEHAGALLVVQEGTTQADTVWLCTSNVGGTLNTTAIAFSQMSVSGALLASNNLSDVANAATARANLGLGTAATLASSAVAQTANNLSDLANAATARTNLGLAIGTNVQAFDADLTTIAGLTATTDNFLVSVASAWASRTPAQVRTTLALVVGTNVQAWDTDLDAIAGLTPTNDDIIQRKAGAWTNRSMAQLKTDLVLVKADVGLGNVDNTSNATERAAARTVSNMRVTRRVGTTASSATPTINTDNVDKYRITALAAAITGCVMSGTPADGDTFWLSITDNGTARAITLGSSFEASGNVALPTTTVVNVRLDMLFVWNVVTSKWRIVAVA